MYTLEIIFDVQIFANIFSSLKLTGFGPRLLRALKGKEQGTIEREVHWEASRENPLSGFIYLPVSDPFSRPQSGYGKWCHLVCLELTEVFTPTIGRGEKCQKCVKCKWKGRKMEANVKVRMDSRRVGEKTISVVRICLDGKGRDFLSASPVMWFGSFPFTSQENY